MLSSYASYLFIAFYLPNLLFFVLFMKLGLDPIDIFPLPAGTMFSLSTESNKGTVQGITEEGASYPSSGELFRAAAMA